jgi:hypothetical protein
MECGMERKFHRGFTAAEKTELWDRWKRGESLKAIGRAFGKESSFIYFLVAPHGGIRPAERRRSRLASCMSLSGRRRFGESSRLIRRNQSSSARQSPLVQACFDCSCVCTYAACRPAGHLCRLLIRLNKRVTNSARTLARSVHPSHRSHRSARHHLKLHDDKQGSRRRRQTSANQS